MVRQVRPGVPDNARPGRSAVVVVRVEPDAITLVGGDRGERILPEPVNPLLTSKEIAELLEISPSAWRNYVGRGTAPPADDTSNPNQHRWLMSSLAAFTAKQKRPRRWKRWEDDLG